MYRLNNVYGVINFFADTIKILIVEISNCKQNCLYFNSIKYDGMDENFEFNYQEVKTKLEKELIKIDKCFETKINRYLLNVPNLPITIEKISLNNKSFHSIEEIYDYVDETLSKKAKSPIYKSITNIDKINDNKKIDILNSISNNNIECKCYCIDLKIANQFHNLFNELMIGEISFNNNALIYNFILDQKKNKKLLIDVGENNINLITYNKTNEIIDFKSIPYGINKFKKWLQSKIQTNSRQCSRIINNISKILMLDNHVIIGNYHNNEYLSTKILSVNDFKLIIKNKVNNCVEKIASELIDKNYDEIIFNCDNPIVELFKHTNKINPLNFCGQSIKIISKTINCLNEYLNSALILLEKNNYEYSLSKNINLISIDPYISESLSNKQVLNSLLNKAGVYATGILAKISNTKSN